MDERIPLIPGKGSTWEPTHEQEMTFGGESHRTRLMKDYIKDLYKKISENIGETPEEFHYDYFKLEDGELYYRGKRKPLTTKGKPKSVGMLSDILGKGGLRNLGFDIPKGKLTAQQAVMLNKAAEELPSESDITRADDVELQEIAKKVSKSTEDLIFQINNHSQTDKLFEYPSRNLLGLDKQLRIIRGSLMVEVAKKFQLEECIKKEHRKLEEFREYPRVYDDATREEITKRIDALNEDLKVRQASIDLLKGRLKNQITSFRVGYSGDLRQGSSNNSVTNFVQGFPYVFQREKQPSFEDLLLVVLVILRRRFLTRFRPKVSLFNFAISEQYFRFSI